MRTIDPSDLDFLLLGLLGGGPRSGYDLRKQIAESPLRVYSDSPGAIYPALRRLARRGWIAEGPPEGPRGRRAFCQTPRGQSAFVSWLRRPVEQTDVMGSGEALLLRFAFMGAVLPRAEIRQFLERFEEATAAYLASVRRHYESRAAALPATGRLALEYGIADFESRVRWARKARKELDEEGPEDRKGGD
jgi:DNA-binding PadR family transcriptional regulator